MKKILTLATITTLALTLAAADSVYFSRTRIFTGGK